MLLLCLSLPLSEGRVVGYRCTNGIEEKANRVLKARASQSLDLDSDSSFPLRSHGICQVASLDRLLDPPPQSGMSRED